jgi:UDPglucose 6-dehydrogenase
MQILIIGNGVVGKNIQKIFPESVMYDKHKRGIGIGIEDVLLRQYDIAFICVPTDKKEDGSCDTSKVREVVKYFRDNVKVFCIKSTIPPGTTYKIADLICNRVVFSPEYYGETRHANDVDYNFVILGGSRNLTGIVAAAYEEKFTGDLKIFQTDSITAELVKYGENAYLANKVTFCNEFARLCECFGVDYREWRELWLQDPRVNRSHTLVFKKAPFYDSKCLNKDVPAIIKAAQDAGYNPEFLEAMEAYNSSHKK